MNIKDNVKTFFKDNVRISACLMTLTLCGLHIYEYFSTGKSNCLFRVGLYGILTLTLFLSSLKLMYFMLILLALIASHFNPFLNFTAFFVLLLACRMNRRSEKWLIPIYTINVSFALYLQKCDILDLLIHLVTCAFFYLVYFFLNRPKKLELKEDEEEIIKQMAQGKLQKEINLYSKNIVKDKLDHAKDRNHIMTTDELITLYKQSHP